MYRYFGTSFPPMNGWFKKEPYLYGQHSCPPVSSERVRGQEAPSRQKRPAGSVLCQSLRGDSSGLPRAEPAAPEGVSGLSRKGTSRPRGHLSPVPSPEDQVPESAQQRHPRSFELQALLGPPDWVLVDGTRSPGGGREARGDAWHASCDGVAQ